MRKEIVFGNEEAQLTADLLSGGRFGILMIYCRYASARRGAKDAMFQIIWPLTEIPEELTRGEMRLGATDGFMNALNASYRKMVPKLIGKGRQKAEIN